MHLHVLRVEHYRAIARAEVHLDAVSVLIGENDCGKSSLLEALRLALHRPAGDRAPRFRPFHFHRSTHADGALVLRPIRIELHFRERHAGAWDVLRDGALGPLLRRASTRARELQLEIVADPPRGDEDVTARVAIRVTGSAGIAETSEPAALAALRACRPLVWLRGGQLTEVRDEHALPPLDTSAWPAALAPLVERVVTRHAEVIDGTTVDVERSIADGVEAARELLAHGAPQLGGRRLGFRPLVAELLGQLPATADDAPGRMAPGSRAQRIGVLALTASVLRALGAPLAEGSEPLWVIEDPESGLHPMTLASVMTFVSRIRGQRLLTTESGDVLASVPLGGIRRLVRTAGEVREWRVRPRALSAEDVRRVGYHLRARRGVAMFARCWLLVEGETEFWLLPELARILGYDLAEEGVACVEFAQSGLGSIVRLARELGIEWHVLADGDRAGESYGAQAMGLARGAPVERRVTTLAEADIEHSFFRHGYAQVFRDLAGVHEVATGGRQVIVRAIKRRSKPAVALELVLAASASDAPPVPPQLARAVTTCVALARGEALPPSPEGRSLRYRRGSAPTRALR